MLAVLATRSNYLPYQTRSILISKTILIMYCDRHDSVAVPNMLCHRKPVCEVHATRQSEDAFVYEVTET